MKRLNCKDIDWQFIEKVGPYSFWKYEDQDGMPVYNCTTDGNKPNTDGGYYSYGYLLKVKGILSGVTIGSLLD